MSARRNHKWKFLGQFSTSSAAQTSCDVDGLTPVLPLQLRQQ